MKKALAVKSGFAIIFLAIVFVLGNCDKKKDETPSPSSPGGSPGANEVWMQNRTFNPSSITIKMNESVKWTNKDGETHTVVSNSGLFNSGNISGGGTFSFTFKSRGTFPYHCTLHPGMNGTVIVQ